MKITLVQQSAGAAPKEDDYTLWQVEISQEDYNALVEKYTNDGYSVRGTKQQVLEELESMV